MINWINTRKRHLSLSLLAQMLVPLLVVVVALLVALWDPIPLQILRNALFDQYQRWQPRVYQEAPVRIIDIDDESLRRLGQ